VFHDVQTPHCFPSYAISQAFFLPTEQGHYFELLEKHPRPEFPVFSVAIRISNEPENGCDGCHNQSHFGCGFLKNPSEKRQVWETEGPLGLSN
jgi:hypothetical protein